jgi:hypothetical protein
MKVAGLILGAALASSPSAAKTEMFLTSGELQSACLSKDRGKLLTCSGYIIGVVDAADVVGARVCLDNSRLVIDTVIAHLATHPVAKNESAAQVVMEALKAHRCDH